MMYRAIQFNLEFVEGEGNVSHMPTHGGIYAEIHWPTRSIRIGETGNSMRGRNRSHMRWADKHRMGTHNARETARQGVIVELAKQWGSEGLEYFVITDDPIIREDREMRVQCEKWLHEWARVQTDFQNVNAQRGYRTRN
ncbi:MAG: hypothetical protein AAF739_05150 [Pseudomonadota bacterium]